MGYVWKNKFVSLALGISFVLPGTTYLFTGGVSANDYTNLFTKDWFGQIFIVEITVMFMIGILFIWAGLQKDKIKNK